MFAIIARSGGARYVTLEALMVSAGFLYIFRPGEGVINIYYGAQTLCVGFTSSALRTHIYQSESVLYRSQECAF